MTIGITVDASQVPKGAAQLDTLKVALSGVDAKLKQIETTSSATAAATQRLSGAYQSSMASIQAASQAAVQANTALAQSFRSIEQAAQMAARQVSASVLSGKALAGAGAESVASLQAAAKAGVAYAQSMASVTEAQRQFQAGQKATQQSTKQMSTSITGLIGSLKGFAAAFGVTLGVQGLIGFTQSVVEAGIANERLMLSLKGALGSAQAAGEAYQFVEGVANRLGIGLETAVTGFAKLSAATQGTIAQGEGTRELFVAISEASRVMGLSTEDTGGVITALTQIIGKNTVSMEELRQQLGERLPQVLRLTAKEMGLTTAAFIDMVSKGKVLAEDFIPAVTRAMREMGREAPTAAASVQAALERIGNAWLTLKITIAQSGLLELVGAIAEEIVRIINQTTNWINRTKRMAGEMGLQGLVGEMQRVTQEIQTWQEIAQKEQVGSIVREDAERRIREYTQQREALASQIEVKRQNIELDEQQRKVKDDLTKVDIAHASAKQKEVAALEKAGQSWIGYADDIEEAEKALAALRSFDVEKLQALRLDPFKLSPAEFEKQWNQAQTHFLKRIKELKDKQAGIEKGASDRAVREAGETAVEIARAREEAQEASLKRQIAEVQEATSTQRRLIDEDFRAALKEQGPEAVTRLETARAEALLTVRREEAQAIQQIRLDDLEQSAELRKQTLQAEVEAAGTNLSAKRKALEALANLEQDTAAARATITKDTAKVEAELSKKSVDDLIKHAKELNKLRQQIDDDQRQAAITRVDEEIQLVEAQVEAEILTREQGLETIRGLQEKQFELTRTRLEQQAMLEIRAIEDGVEQIVKGSRMAQEAHEDGARKIAAIRTALAADIEALNAEMDKGTVHNIDERRHALEETANFAIQQVNREVAANLEGNDEIVQAKQLAAEQIRAINLGLTANLEALSLKQETQTLQHLTKQRESWRELAEGIADSLSSVFEKMFEGTQNLGEEIKKWFKKLIADLAAYALTNAVIIPILTSVFGQGGAQGAGGQLLQGLLGMGGGGAGGIFKALGIGGTGGAGGLGDLLGLGTIAKSIGGFFGPGGTVTGIFEGFAGHLNTLFGTGPSQALLEGALVETGAGITPTSGVGGLFNAANLMQSMGGLAAGIGGLTKAITAKTTGGRVTGSLTAALGFAALVPGPQQPFLLAAAALTAILGPMIEKMFSPKGPRFGLTVGGGLGIQTEGERLTVTGKLTSRVGKAERLPEGTNVEAIQEALQVRVQTMVQGMVEAINTAALAPGKLLGQTQDALNQALRNALRINTSSVENFQKDLEEQTKFVAVQVGSFFLKPLVGAFRQLESAELETQIDRLPSTTKGMVEIFKAMNVQLDELSKVANTDVLRQLSRVRNRVEDFGNSLADTARVVAERIADGLRDQLTTQAEQLFDRPLAEQVLGFQMLLAQSARALLSLQQTEKILIEAGLRSGGVRGAMTRMLGTVVDVIDRVSEEMVSDVEAAMREADIQTQMERFPEAIMGLANALGSIRQFVDVLNREGIDSAAIRDSMQRVGARIVSAATQMATTIVDSVITAGAQAAAVVLGQGGAVQRLTAGGVFTQRLQAVGALRGGQAALASQGLDTSGLQEQLNRLFKSMITDAYLIMRDALAEAPFDQALQVVLAIPEAVTALNPVLARMRAIAEAFAPVVGALQEDIETLIEATTPFSQRLAESGAHMVTLGQALVEVDPTDFQTALGLADELRQEIVRNAELQIQAIEEIAAAWEAAMSLVESRIAELEDEIRPLAIQVERANANLAITAQRFQELAAAGDTKGAIEAAEAYGQAISANAELQRRAVTEQRQAELDRAQAAIDAIDAQIEAQDAAMEATRRQIDAWEELSAQQQEVIDRLQEEQQVRQDLVDTLTQQIHRLQDLRQRVGELVRGGQPPAQAVGTIRAEIAAERQALASATTREERTARFERLVELNEQLMALGEQTDQLILIKEGLDNLGMIWQELAAEEARAAGELTVADRQLKATEALLAPAEQQLAAIAGQITVLEKQVEGQERVVRQLEEQKAWAQAIFRAIEEDKAWTQAIARINEAELGALYELRAWLIAIQGGQTWEQQIAHIQQAALAQLTNMMIYLRALYELAATDTNIASHSLNAQAYQVQAAQYGNLLLEHIQAGRLINPLPIKVENFYDAPRQRGGLVGLPSGLHYAAGGMVPTLLEPRERVFAGPLTHAQMGALTAVNQAFPRFGSSWSVPGQGSGDTVPAWVPSGSFVLNRRAAGAMGYQGGGTVPPQMSRAEGTVHNHFDLRGANFRSTQDAKEIIRIIDEWSRKRGNSKL